MWLSLSTTLRTGSFLTTRLLYIACIAIVLSLCSSLTRSFYTQNASAQNQFTNKLYDTDFIAFYAAGKLSKEGAPEKAYDWEYHAKAQNSVFVLERNFPLTFPYPPFFMKVMDVFSYLSYQQAWIAFQGITILAALLVIYRTYPSAKILLAFFAFFPVFLNVSLGQTAFLTTALFGAFLINLEKRPWLAGVFLGLLAYKPQFGILIPLVLIISKQWKPFLCAVFTIMVMIVIVSISYEGHSIWYAFYNGLIAQKSLILEENLFFPLSIFTTVRWWSGSIFAAYTTQAIVQIFLLAYVIYLWRNKNTASFSLKAAGLVLAAILFTPYLLAYDLVLLAIPFAYLVKEGMEKGWQPYQKTLLFSVWLLSFFEGMLRETSPVSVGTIIALTLLGYVGWLARESNKRAVRG